MSFEDNTYNQTEAIVSEDVETKEQLSTEEVLSRVDLTEVIKQATEAEPEKILNYFGRQDNVADFAKPKLLEFLSDEEWQALLAGTVSPDIKQRVVEAMTTDRIKLNAFMGVASSPEKREEYLKAFCSWCGQIGLDIDTPTLSRLYTAAQNVRMVGLDNVTRMAVSDILAKKKLNGFEMDPEGLAAGSFFPDDDLLLLGSSGVLEEKNDPGHVLWHELGHMFSARQQQEITVSGRTTTERMNGISKESYRGNQLEWLNEAITEFVSAEIMKEHYGREKIFYTYRTNLNVFAELLQIVPLKYWVAAYLDPSKTAELEEKMKERLGYLDLENLDELFNQDTSKGKQDTITTLQGLVANRESLDDESDINNSDGVSES